jgi:hypothetical protein
VEAVDCFVVVLHLTRRCSCPIYHVQAMINESPSSSPSASKVNSAGNPAAEMLRHSRPDWGCLDKKGNDGAKSSERV